MVQRNIPVNIRGFLIWHEGIFLKIKRVPCIEGSFLWFKGIFLATHSRSCKQGPVAAPLPDDGMCNSPVHGQPRNVAAFLRSLRGCGVGDLSWSGLRVYRA